MLHLTLFLVFGAVCLAGAINLLVQRHPINSALSLVAVMSTGPKAAVFAVLLRIIFEAHAPGALWFIWATAALSMGLVLQFVWSS